MTWCYKVGKELVGEETVFGIVEHYPQLEAHTDTIKPYGYESVDDLVVTLERMLRAAQAAKENNDLIINLNK